MARRVSGGIGSSAATFRFDSFRPMKISALLARFSAATLVFAFAFSAATPAATAASSRPFIERVKPDDYHAAEKLFAEPFSRAHELVVLRTTAAKPVSVLALQRNATGDTYTITFHFASAGTPDGWLKISEELDAPLAQQVLRAFELKLHRQVTLSTFQRRVSKTDSDLWVHQRLSDDRVAAALIAMEVTLDNPQASLFIDDFLGGLQQLIGTEGHARRDLLLKIDRMATKIILAETPR